MKTAFLDYLVCPFDRAPLTIAVEQQRGEIIERGALTCSQCGEEFLIQNGIPNMLSPRLESIALKRAEIKGWVEIARVADWSVVPDELDLALPYVVERLGWDPRGSGEWEATRLSLEHLWDKYVCPGMRVLEVGAAKSWAAHYFMERGCEYIGCDILDDSNIGIGRARFFGARFGHYEVAVADGEALPFRDSNFDLVFAIAALHHALDLGRMLSEMARVARRGAVVAGLNEGVRAVWANANSPVQMEVLSHGINEHAHTLWTYTKAFRENGLALREMTRSIGYEFQLAPRLKLVLDGMRRVPCVGERSALWLLLGLIHAHDGASFYAVKV